MDAAMSELYPETVFYEDYDKMLEEANLDVVIVETGADIHTEFCCKALEKDINVFAEIPLVASLAEAEKIWKVSQASKAMISVGANPNYKRFTYHLKDFYKKGLLGEPVFMEAEYIHWTLPTSESHKHYNENGDWRKLLCPIRYCTHSLGPLLTVVKEDLRYVSCFGTGRRAPASEYGSNPDFNKDDLQSAQFRTEDGVVVHITRAGRVRSRIPQHSYRAFGTEGYIELMYRDWRNWTIQYNSMKELDTELHVTEGKVLLPEYENNAKAEAAGHGGMDYAMMDYFFRALCNGEAAPVPVKEGLRMTLPGIYAEESAKRGGQVMKIRYPWDEDWTTEFDD
jgi:predicted dehydrogenase